MNIILSYIRNLNLLILIAFLSPSIFAADYYVDQSNVSADDSNIGSESFPWKTFKKAVNTATAGDTVKV